jgi:hypothetical protein
MYLRSDYSVDCTSDTYKSYLGLASFGIILFPVGIPALFFAIIRLRNHSLLSQCSRLLFGNFDISFRYFEVYDLMRKLLLTSIVSFVSDPSSPTRCLYLLVLDLISLHVILVCQPYATKSDDMLACCFVVVECIAFFIALLVTSGISAEENYHAGLMYGTLLCALVISLVGAVPFTYALKFDAVSSLFSRNTERDRSTATATAGKSFRARRNTADSFMLSDVELQECSDPGPVETTLPPLMMRAHNNVEER